MLTFASGSVKAATRQRTTFGVDAIIGLEIPSASVLKPDLHVKGTDYTENTVPERALVESLQRLSAQS